MSQALMQNKYKTEIFLNLQNGISSSQVIKKEKLFLAGKSQITIKITILYQTGLSHSPTSCLEVDV